MRKIITAGLQGPNHGKLKEIPPRVLQLKRSVATPVGRDGRGGSKDTSHHHRKDQLKEENVTSNFYCSKEKGS